MMNDTKFYHLTPICYPLVKKLHVYIKKEYNQKGVIPCNQYYDTFYGFTS